MRLRTASAFATAVAGLAGVVGTAGTAEAGFAVDVNPADGVPEFIVRTVNDAPPFNYTSIQAALNDSSNPLDIVVIHAGTYDEDITWVSPIQIQIQGNVTIRAATQGASAVIRALGGTPTFLSNIGTGVVQILPHASATNQRAVTGADFAGVRVDLTIQNIDFTGFQATGNGGALFNLGTGHVESCDFTDCSATGSGGAVFGTSDGSDVLGTVDNCTFTDCHADVNGGAVANMDTVEDSEFEHCTAGGNGGGLHGIQSSILRCIVTRCEAAGAGGGGIAESDAAVSRCRIGGNKATNTGANMGRGGGLFKCCVGQISNCLVLSNEAEGDGGGMFDCDANIKYVNFIFNDAGGVGGAARNCDGTIKNCIFARNTSSGGANADMLSNCGNPTTCFVHDAWSGGGSGNKRNVDANGDDDPRFDTPGISGGMAAFESFNLELFQASPTNRSICIENAAALADPTIDFDGQNRSTTVPDIGAFEK